MEDSYITDPPQYKNVRMTVFIIIYTSFHIFASTAIGDGTSIYAKMLKSTAYLQPSKELQKFSL